jgi:hypothetical protein
MNRRTRRRLTIGAAVLATSILLPTVGANAMVNGLVQDRTVAGGEPSLAKKPQGQSFQRAAMAQAQRKGCKLSCVKRTLSALIKNHNKLVKAYNSLARDYYKCERTTPVTSYDGYWYDDFQTTALDFTEPGTPVDEHMVVYVC